MSLALGAVALMVLAALAAATHIRPKAATPIRVSLVPAFKQCTAPNRQHGPPLAFPSCAPPVPTSSFVTVGTPDSNGAGANSTGYLRVRVKMTSPEDVLLDSVITDVRCRPGTSSNVCNSANATDGPDYSGELQGNAMIRISDHYNGPNLNEAATVQDIPFPVNLKCENTADTSVGGHCTIPPPTVICPECGPKEGVRTVVEITQLQIFDGGPDGQIATNDGSTLFMNQGVFIP
jgi:hypothetical protein